MTSSVTSSPDGHGTDAMQDMLDDMLDAMNTQRQLANHHHHRSGSGDSSGLNSRLSGTRGLNSGSSDTRRRRHTDTELTQMDEIHNEPTRSQRRKSDNVKLTVFYDAVDVDPVRPGKL